TADTIMSPNILPLPYQILYILLPTVSIVGNGSIVYVTIRSKSLRSPCNILIALLSLADAVQSFSNYIFAIAYNLEDAKMSLRLDATGQGRNEDVRAVMQTAPVQLKMREQRLRWYGHVLRRPQDHPIRTAMEFEVEGKRPRGAPKKRWRDVIKKDLRSRPRKEIPWT
ncbi:hypothetical protein TELCIR_15099, partial [Teladorsagia circumcincta]